MAQKINQEFIIAQFESGIESYSNFTIEVGLWDSEKYVFEKNLQKTDSILDLGCGTGRTTFALKKMGFDNLIGVDLTPAMIAEANKLNAHFGFDIGFSVGNALTLEFEDAAFDSVLFSFNGLMTIPQSANREKAVKEINRVLKPGSVFIFTTHDREIDVNHLKFWEEQAKVWKAGKQDTDLYEFGDVITTSKNEKGPIYIHIPDKQEVISLLSVTGFEVVETFYRSELFNEPEKVKQKSGECRFWVARKV